MNNFQLAELKRLSELYQVEIQRLINIYNNWDKNVKVDFRMSVLRAKQYADI